MLYVLKMYTIQKYIPKCNINGEKQLWHLKGGEAKTRKEKCCILKAKRVK